MERISKNGDSLVRGKFLLYNNLWGAATGTGTQCLWAEPGSGPDIAWGTDWNWTGPDYSVKSYSAAVLGWHWGWRIQDTGLPIRLSQKVRTSWSFQLTQTTPGKVNVTLDLWLASNPHLGDENPDGEVMVWLNHSAGIRPIGSNQDAARIGGSDWAVWQGPHPASGWPVYSFVRTTNAATQSLDLAEFFRYLIALGLNDANYLIGLEAGIEVFTGAGRLDTTSYSVEIEHGSSNKATA
jgi:hypothetical protein